MRSRSSSCWRLRWWRWVLLWLCRAHPLDPRLESERQVGEEFLRGFVGELAFLVELGLGGADEHLRPRQHQAPELDEDPAHVVLNARAAERALRSGEDGDRLVH